ncbi:MAG: hypothetical protein LUE98_03695 [Tannerellaceae bacterium]|nr:hypothetical protein [Tannerellaceae bacterium]
MIKLSKIENGVLVITAKDIISQIPDIANYNWKLLWIDAVSNKIEELNLPDGLQNMKDLMETINNSSTGYSINYKTLISLCDSLEQLVEFILIGDKLKENLSETQDDKKIKENIEFFIELVDGSYWEITSKNSIFNQRIITYLCGIEVEDQQIY